jgi:hypothetical protein
VQIEELWHLVVYQTMNTSSNPELQYNWKESAQTNLREVAGSLAGEQIDLDR